jgi:hypothetical protein
MLTCLFGFLYFELQWNILDLSFFVVDNVHVLFVFGGSAMRPVA